MTGHSYIIYGPLANGATTLMFEGVPNYPDVSRFWQVVDKHRVTILYTSPTAIRSLMREGEAPVKASSSKSLRLLGSVGEPINPGGLGVVSPRGRRRPLPRGRHLVADRDRRDPDHPASGRRSTSSRDPRRCRSSACSPPSWTMTGESSRARARAISCCSTAGPARCAPSTAITSASSTPISRASPGKYFTGDGAKPRCGRLLLDHRPRGRRDQRGRPPARYGRDRERPGRTSASRRSRGGRLPARHQGPGDLCLRDADRRHPSRASRCGASFATGCARRSARSRRRMSFNGRPRCRRRAPARSCGASCARSRRTNPISWATSRRSPIPASSSSWSRSTPARCAAAKT